MESPACAKFISLATFFLPMVPTELEAAATSDCKTVSGYSSDVECVFPFTFDGITHSTCTIHGNADSEEKPWCSTKVDIHGVYIEGNWGVCSPECPVEDGCWATDRRNCAFPFEYEGRNYDKCTWDYAFREYASQRGSHTGCGTREDASFDWGNCGEGCHIPGKKEPRLVNRDYEGNVNIRSDSSGTTATLSVSSASKTKTPSFIFNVAKMCN